MPTRAAYSFEQFSAVRAFTPAAVTPPPLSFSPDGSEIAYSTNTSGQFNLWKQSSAGGYPIQLTTFTEHSVREIQWSPDGHSILFTADYQGDEFHQIYVIPANGGIPEQLTNVDKVQHYIGAGWSPDGKRIAFAANDRDASDFDVCLRDQKTGNVKRVLFGEAFYVPASWSPDGRYLTAVKANSNTDLDVYVVDLKTGKSRLVTAHEGEVKFGPLAWKGDGSGFWLVTDLDREYSGLAFYSLADEAISYEETPEWDIEGADYSKDANLLVWIVNEHGYSKVHARNVRTSKPVSLPEIGDGVIRAAALSKDGRKAAFIFTAANQPDELFISDIKKGKVDQITNGWTSGIGSDDLQLPKLVHYPTHDGRKIPAFLYKPKGKGPHPFAVVIHGGPEAQERPSYNYSGMYQYLLTRGIGIFALNVRGSTGYGKSYQKLIHRDWGGAELKDFDHAVRYLKSQPWVDGERLAVFGGSFGGFATLSCVTRLPEYWACGVDVFGPSNLVTFAKAVPPSWKRFMEGWLGDPDTEADMLLARSPITYVDKVRCPMFIIQGANDPRVVKAESDQLVEKLRERKIDVSYDVYDDEGHGFAKQVNRVKAMGDIAKFLEKHLIPQG
jgi:dipeptidyl aminopeptidase/acylaminoacyl peptidase